MNEKAMEYQLGFSQMHREAMYDLEQRSDKALKTIAVIRDYLDGVDADPAALSLLDIGCSTGLLTSLYGQHFGQVAGIDIDTPAVEFAQRTTTDDHIEFHVRDSMATGFPDDSFDAVTCTQVYEHVPDANRLIAEIYRVLKPGGFCYFAAGNRVKFMEAHYRLPLLSVIPKSLAHIYIRLAGKAESYYETHFSYWGLRKLVSRFHIVDYTRRVIADPVTFNATDLIAPGSFKQKLSLAILSMAYWTCPTYIWILRKPDQPMQTQQLAADQESAASAKPMRAVVKKFLAALPFGNAALRGVLSLGFRGSPDYWEARYAKGNNSGAGSYGALADFKGRFLRDFMRDNEISSVVDFGCGDGNQIGYLEPVPYVGLDVSATAIEICRQKYRDDKNKRFFHFVPGTQLRDLSIEPCQMAMSLDVIFHLVEDGVFDDYIQTLFSAASRYVVIYASNCDKLTESPHVRHRHVTAHVARAITGWNLCQHVENPYKGDLSESDFFVYERDAGNAG